MLRITRQLRHACRRLLNVPGFTLLCVLTLAVGIGSVVAVFSILEGVLLRPLPYPDAGRLVGLWHRAPGLELGEIPQSSGTYRLYQGGSRALEGIALYRETAAHLTGGPTPERLEVIETTASLFTVLGTPPRLGRAFTSGEERPGGPAVVVLSDSLWRERFGADPRILGRSVRLDGEACQVVGIMPPGFGFPGPESDLWRPLKLDPANPVLGQFDSFGVARLAAGATMETAETDLNRLLVGLPEKFPQDAAAPVLAGAGFAALVRPLQDDLVGSVGDTLWILLGAVGFVLLIACANVANLLFVRGEARRREMAIYTALGAPRSHLIGGALAESCALALAGGVLGVLLAAAGVRLLLYLKPAQLPRLQEIRIDGAVLAFAVGVSLLASLLFGLLPALRSTGLRDLASELKGGGRSVTLGRSRLRTRQILIGLQLALALVLLTGSGLMVRSFLRLARVHPGFEPAEVLVLQLSLREPKGPAAGAGASAALREVLSRVQTLSGVESAAVTSSLPLSGSAPERGYGVEGLRRESGAPPPVFGFQVVSEDYFRTLRIPIVAGRPLEPADLSAPGGAVVVSEPLARRYWPEGNAVGKRLRILNGGSEDSSWSVIVGVAGGVRNRAVGEEPGEIVYHLLPRSHGVGLSQVSLAVRSRQPPEVLADGVRREIRAVAPDLPVDRVEPLEAVVERAGARMSFSLTMLGIATAVALVLGGVGLYGFVSYLVRQRTPEIGVRVALGARAGTIRWMILREALTVAATGLVAGLAGALALTRWLESLLFEVSPLDPVTFATVPFFLVVLVIVSSYVPADEAARIDPLTALQRSE
ncbi:MAG TPA: ABC transporter permease [Thermoanaerobaculia bacterium]|nr:ABC transporter permease [Thermoanaerobaculia bacterium]